MIDSQRRRPVRARAARARCRRRVRQGDRRCARRGARVGGRDGYDVTGNVGNEAWWNARRISTGVALPHWNGSIAYAPGTATDIQLDTTQGERLRQQSLDG